MRVHAVSDVHGASADLARAADGADVFVCLGDLLLYLDYEDPAEGAFSEVFGAEVTAEYIRLRRAMKFDEARALTTAAWQKTREGDHPANRMRVFGEIIERQYSELFAAMPAMAPTPAFLTYGNVDVPAYWENFIRPGQQVMDGDVAVVDGIRFGFVGGGLFSPYRTPNEISPEAYAAKVAALGAVDVLCTHIPPSVAELTFDVVARRFEVGSKALLQYIEDVQPQFALFGHVHQPFASRKRIGRTECLNVGHFRATRRPFVLDLPR